jgi:hypothetical protein
MQIDRHAGVTRVDDKLLFTPGQAEEHRLTAKKYTRRVFFQLDPASARCRNDLTYFSG